MKKIAIVTATRAEYGLLSNLMEQLEQDAEIELQLFITGSHLLKESAESLAQIKQKYSISAEIIILKEDSNSDLDIAIATSKALAGFATAFAKHNPNIVVVLGDRYELLGVCSAALLSHIPIAHIHGGEITEGAMDDAIRHSITKLSNIHFVAAEEYKQRVIQMGEQPNSVFNVGAVGLDIIDSLKFLTKQQLEQNLQIALNGNLLLITYHPVSWGSTMGELVLQKLFSVLELIADKTIIWTGSNADASGKQLNIKIKQWIKRQPDAHFVNSLGSQRYLSLMKVAGLVLGNSSSGIIEAPALGIATVNIGERQAGRLKASSIIDCGETKAEIVQAIEKALGTDFKKQAASTKSLYGSGHTTAKIIEHLKVFLDTSTKQNLQKKFNDLNLDLN